MGTGNGDEQDTRTAGIIAYVKGQLNLVVMEVP